MQPINTVKGSNSLTFRLFAALLAGIGVGFLCHAWAPRPAIAQEIAGYFSIGTDVFLRLIKMILAPLVLSTVVSGIASFGDSGAIGRIAARSLAWFLCASLVSLGLGLLLANLFSPGSGVSLTVASTAAGATAVAAPPGVREFITHIVPTSLVQAMASNDILQILVFSVFLGVALSGLKPRSTQQLAHLMDEVMQVMLRITELVMWFAPLGVFAAMAAVITTQGLGILLTYGKFIGSFYAGLAVLWAMHFGVGAFVLGKRNAALFALLREPMLLAFSTASSEAAFPKMIEKLSAFGVSKRISGLVLPLGYSFNLVGSMMYQAFAMLFIAQAYAVHMPLGRQIGLLLLMLVTSKGIAGVPRASLVVVAATLPFSGLPPEGLMLIIGIDQLLDMGRTMTNVIGNGVATAIVCKWEGLLEPDDASERRGSVSPTVGHPGEHQQDSLVDLHAKSQ